MKRTAFTVDVRFGDGVRSILLGFAALILLVGALAVFRFGTDNGARTLRVLLGLGILFLLAPVLSVKGLAAGRRGLAGGAGKGTAVAGVLLNFVLLLVEIAFALLVWFAMRSGFPFPA